MTEVSLGKTGITVNKNGFGALPIQRIPQDDAVKLVRRAFERGINFFDTARSYTDSEAKLGVALKGIREQVFIATKTPSVTAAGFWNDLETSLRLLQTDYIDIYQFHNPAFCPKPGDGSGLYEAMQQAREQGKIRFIGITNHRLAVAGEAIESDLYATLQFPFSYLTTEKELELVRACAAHGMGNRRLGEGLFLEPGERFDWPDPAAPDSGTEFCHGLRSQIAVLCDGTVVPCCLDSEGRLALGNLHRQELAEILASPRATAMAAGFSRRQPSEELCRRCGYAARFSR